MLLCGEANLLIKEEKVAKEGEEKAGGQRAEAPFLFCFILFVHPYASTVTF